MSGPPRQQPLQWTRSSPNGLTTGACVTLACMKQARISRRGQVSIPADVRHRWKTDRIMIEDRGYEVIVRPFPADPIAAARGYLKPLAPDDAITSDEARARTRAEEAAGGPGAIR